MNKKIIRRTAIAAICSLAVFGIMVLFGENAIARTTPFPSNIIISDDLNLVYDSLNDEHEDNDVTSVKKYEIRGSKYKYGDISLRTLIYNKYIENDDRMVYYVFSESHICGEAKTNKGYYHANMMKLNINATYKDAYNVSYFPMGANYLNNSNDKYVTINCNYPDYSYKMLAPTMKEINLYTTTDTELNNCNTLLEFRLLNYKKKSSSEKYPYVGDFYSISTCVYEVDNYSTNNLIKFDIEYSGRIYRRSLTKSKNYLMERIIKHSYLLSDDSVLFTPSSTDVYDI